MWQSIFKDCQKEFVPPAPLRQNIWSVSVGLCMSKMSPLFANNSFLQIFLQNKLNWIFDIWNFKKSFNRFEKYGIMLKNFKCYKTSLKLDTSIQCKLSRLWAVSQSQLSRVYILPFSHFFRNVKGKEISWSRLWIVNRKLLISYFLTDFLECEKAAGRSYHEASICLCHPPCDICYKWVNNNGCIWFDLVTFNLPSSLWYLL